MSDGSSDLAARALAAAAAEQAEREERDRQAQRQEAAEDARMRRELEAAAASVASQILGCPISPSQWKANRDRRYDTEYGQTWMVSEFWYAGAVIEGVPLVTSIWKLPGPNLPPRIFVGGLRGPALTLASFGEALEAQRAEREAAEGQR